MLTQVVVESVRSGDADSPIGKLCHAAEHSAKTRSMTITLVIFAVGGRGKVPVGSNPSDARAHVVAVAHVDYFWLAIDEMLGAIFGQAV